MCLCACYYDNGPTNFPLEGNRNTPFELIPYFRIAGAVPLPNKRHFCCMVGGAVPFPKRRLVLLKGL